MTIQQQIESENIQALKEGDKQKRKALSYLLSELQSAAKDRKVEALADQDAISVLMKQRKQRQETITESQKGTGREDAITEAYYEIALIGAFLPTPPSEDSIREVVEKIISELGATSIKDMGKVMGAARQLCAGADPGKLSSIIKEVLLGV